MESLQLAVRTSGDDAVVARRFGAETLLVPVCGGVGDLDSVYTLNEAGTVIWEALARPVPIGELAASLAARFDVTAEEARIDVEAFLGELAALGLVEVGATTGTAR
jgi:hypothetical protein